MLTQNSPGTCPRPHINLVIAPTRAEVIVGAENQILTTESPQLASKTRHWIGTWAKQQLKLATGYTVYNLYVCGLLSISRPAIDNKLSQRTREIIARAYVS